MKLTQHTNTNASNCCKKFLGYQFQGTGSSTV